MMDMHTICAAVEAYGTDNARYPQGVSTWPGLKALINPHFVKEPPDQDGWQHPWEVGTSTGDDYTVVSPGRDGIAGPRTGGTTNSFDCDIVFSNGVFYQWPEGPQG
jgi:hypothetical protein